MPLIRVLAPTGTGITAAIIKRTVNGQQEVVGTGSNKDNNYNVTEFTVNIDENINEGEELNIEIIQQLTVHLGKFMN
jgi:hypothetical protein